MNQKKALIYTTIIFHNLCRKIICFDQIICFLISPLVTTGQNVPGKNYEFLMVISSCLYTVRKIQGLACVSAFNSKKQNISITFTTDFRIFQILKSPYTIDTHC